jgi:hypothetical protein
MEELGQLFHDFNFRVTPVSAKDAIALDKSDPFIRSTYWLAKNCEAIAKFGMETKAASLGSKSSAIVVQTVLLRFLRAAIEGARSVEAARNVSVVDSRLTSKNSANLLGALAEFIDTFAEAMGAKWQDRESLHLSSAGWQALGIIYHDVTFRLKHVDRVAFAAALATKIDWSRDAAIWSDLVTTKIGKDGKPALMLQGAGASTRRAMVQKIRDAMGLTEKLAEFQDDEEE